jgi:hypothetical protein
LAMATYYQFPPFSSDWQGSLGHLWSLPPGGFLQFLDTGR